MSIDKIRYTYDGGIFHDSKGDIKKLAKKLNECIEKINKMEKKIEKIKGVDEYMGKLNLKNEENKEITEWQMDIRIRARVKDLEVAGHEEAIEADVRINYLLRRLMEQYINHGLGTDYFEKEGEIDLGKMGTAKYNLTPVVKGADNNAK